MSKRLRDLFSEYEKDPRQKAALGETIDQVTGALALIAGIMGMVVIKQYEDAPALLFWLGLVLIMIAVVGRFEYDEKSQDWRVRK